MEATTSKKAITADDYKHIFSRTDINIDEVLFPGNIGRTYIYNQVNSLKPVYRNTAIYILRGHLLENGSTKDTVDEDIKALYPEYEPLNRNKTDYIKQILKTRLTDDQLKELQYLAESIHRGLYHAPERMIALYKDVNYPKILDQYNSISSRKISTDELELYVYALKNFRKPEEESNYLYISSQLRRGLFSSTNEKLMMQILEDNGVLKFNKRGVRGYTSARYIDTSIEIIGTKNIVDESSLKRFKEVTITLNRFSSGEKRSMLLDYEYTDNLIEDLKNIELARAFVLSDNNLDVLRYYNDDEGEDLIESIATEDEAEDKIWIAGEHINLYLHYEAEIERLQDEGGVYKSYMQARHEATSNALEDLLAEFGIHKETENIVV